MLTHLKIFYFFHHVLYIVKMISQNASVFIPYNYIYCKSIVLIFTAIDYKLTPFTVYNLLF